MECTEDVRRLRQALRQTLLQYPARQVLPDENHVAAALFALAPGRAEVAAHELVHALEDDFARRALHPEHAFVAEHLGAEDVDDFAQELDDEIEIFMPMIRIASVDFESKSLGSDVTLKIAVEGNEDYKEG